MAHSLTTTQLLDLFFVLEVPFSNSYNALSPMGTLKRGYDVAQAAQTSAKTAIIAWLDDMAANDVTNGKTNGDGVQDELKSVLCQYAQVKFSIGSVQNGGVAGSNGMNYSFAEKRNQLGEYIKTLVPFYKNHEIKAKQLEDQGGRSSYIPFMR